PPAPGSPREAIRCPWIAMLDNVALKAGVIEASERCNVPLETRASPTAYVQLGCEASLARASLEAGEPATSRSVSSEPSAKRRKSTSGPSIITESIANECANGSSLRILISAVLVAIREEP